MHKNMRIILVTFGIIASVVLILGYLFVQWANRPETIAEFKRMDEEKAAKKAADDARKAEIDKEFEAKRENLTLVIDENFANNRFESLDFTYTKFSKFSFEDHEFKTSSIIYHHSPPQNYFIFSQEDFADFAAEMDLGIWGGDAYVGIFWDAQPNGQNAPTYYQAAYSSPNGLYVKTKDVQDFDLGGFLESENNQKLRVERFGKKLRVSVNGRILFDQIVESAGSGKVGICLGDRGISRENNGSMSIDVKSFKVWK